MAGSKGFVSIFIVIIMSFVMILGLSSLSITQGEAFISQSFANNITAYYIAEAGVERAVSLIKRDVSFLMEKEIDYLEDKGNEYISFLINEGITDHEKIKEMTMTYLNTDKVLDDLIDNYFCDSFPNDIISYEIFDRSMFTEYSGNKECYYRISKASPVPGNKRRVQITSEGCADSSKKNIYAEFLINTIGVMDFRHGDSGYPVIDIYLSRLYDFSNEIWKEY